ncbi:unnamed protein product [Closterium sp. NIES-65]|nr:unnamed protein product [Closterium sp. NIES-65]
MRGSDDRVEVFKLAENLWFAGTAQLPPAPEGAASHNGSDDGSGESGENRSERKLQSAAASAPAPGVDPMEQRLAEVGELSARTTELKQVVKRKPAVGFPAMVVSLVRCHGWWMERRVPQNTSVLGDFINSMTCTFDRQAKRFYLSASWSSGGFNNTYDKIGQTRRRGNTTVGSGLIVAASTTDDPTRDWNVFFIPGSYARPLFHAVSHIAHRLAPFPMTSPNDGINSNPDWRAPLHFDTSRLTTFRTFDGGVQDSVGEGTVDGAGDGDGTGDGDGDSDGDGVSDGSGAAAGGDDGTCYGGTCYGGTCYGGTCYGGTCYGGSLPILFPSSSSPSLPSSPRLPLLSPHLPPPSPPTPLLSSPFLRLPVPLPPPLPFLPNQCNRQATDPKARECHHSPPRRPLHCKRSQKVAADGEYDYRHSGTMHFGWTAVNPTPGAPKETVLVANFTTMGAFAITGTSALGTSEAETVLQVVFPRRRQMWVSFMSAFGKDMSASATVARLRLSLRLKCRWRPFRVFLERFKAVGVGGGNSLIQPNIALNSQGVGIMAASLAGRSFYPSAAYATLNANVDVGRINVVGAGKVPLDDYFGYLSDRMLFSNYMAATVDEEGNAWAAVQYVAGQPRTEWSNWGTFVFKVTLHEGEVGGGGNGGDGVNGDNGGNGDTSGNGDDGGNGDTSGNGDDGGNGDTSGNGDDGGNEDHEGK